MDCSNQSPLALRATATAVNAVNAAKQPRHEVRVSTWLSEWHRHRPFTKPRARLAYTCNQDDVRQVSREHIDKDVVTSTCQPKARIDITSTGRKHPRINKLRHL